MTKYAKVPAQWLAMHPIAKAAASLTVGSKSSRQITRASSPPHSMTALANSEQ